MYGSKRVAVRDLNPHILCALCGGYLIQATTVIECLHSFCRSCIVNFLETSRVCPICDAQIHKTRPLLNIRPDQTLQSLVYKLVPGLFQDEMRRRREFHATLPKSDLEDLSLEERGEASLEKEFKPGDDHVSLVLQLAFRESKSKQFEIRDRRYLLCPSEVTIHHLKKFIKMKFHLNDSYKIEMYRAREELSDDLMLQDIALIYSWRGDRPMNLCYTITEPPKTKPDKCFKQTQLVSKQSEVDHIPAALPVAKGSHPESKMKHLTVSSPEDDFSSLTSSTSDVIFTPVSDTNASKSASSSPLSEVMTPLSIVLPVTPGSTSSISALNCNNTTSETLPSACSNIGGMITNNQQTQAAVNLHAANNAKAILSPPFDSTISKQPSAESVTLLTSSTITTSQCKIGTAKQEVSKLMHSVESILSKTPKRNHHKNKSKTLTWTPASEVLAASDNLSKEKNGKNVNKTAKHKLEDNLSELPKCSEVNDGHTSENVDHLISAFKRSQSVIETFSSGAEVDDHGLKSQEVVSNSHSQNGDALLQTEADIFFSYIPKFQKHRKLCAVKRSVSCEGPSVMPVLEVATCDAMEKRNWKKRKLSTLDFDSSKATAVQSCSVALNNVVSATEVNSLTHNYLITEDPAKKSGPQVAVPPGTEKNSQQLASPGGGAQSSTPHTIPFAGTSLPILLPQESPTANSQERPQSKNYVLDPKIKACSRKSNHASSSTTSTNKSNRTSCDVKISDSAYGTKVSKNKKQSRIIDSDSEPSKAYVNKKSLGYIMNKSRKSVSNHCVSLVARGSSSGKPVEEISVDICTSPVEVSNVTSPTPYVTSPATEDRTDNSTLPEIQTPCVNNCVVTLSAKIVPLDLSSKKK